MKLNAEELRGLADKGAKQIKRKIVRVPIYFILEDVYDTYNIGAIFRLADALAVSRIYLCGETETPPNVKIKRASIGTYKVVPWKYKKNVQKAIEELKKEEPDLMIVAVEEGKGSVDCRRVRYRYPLCLIVGNESRGVKKKTMKVADKIVEVPMWGVNRSLNVIVALAIVAYKAIESLPAAKK